MTLRSDKTTSIIPRSDLDDPRSNTATQRSNKATQRVRERGRKERRWEEREREASGKREKRVREEREE